MDLELDSGIVEQVCAQIDALTASIRQILAGPSIPTEPQKLKKAR